MLTLLISIVFDQLLPITAGSLGFLRVSDVSINKTFIVVYNLYKFHCIIINYIFFL
jgi:hypothetical protein